MRCARSTARRFGDDQRGAVAIVFALLVVPTIGIASVAIDYGRLLKIKSSLQFAADAAANAIADDLARPEEALQRSIRTHLDANLPEHLRGMPFELAVPEDRSSVSIRVVQRMKTSIMAIAGVDELETGAIGNAKPDAPALAATWQAIEAASTGVSGGWRDAQARRTVAHHRQSPRRPAPPDRALDGWRNIRFAHGHPARQSAVRTRSPGRPARPRATDVQFGDAERQHRRGSEAQDGRVGANANAEQGLRSLEGALRRSGRERAAPWRPSRSGQARNAPENPADRQPRGLGLTVRHRHVRLPMRGQVGHGSGACTCMCARGVPMHANRFDIVVVGASFAGLVAARTAARRGLKVAVIEAKPEAGARSATTGILVKEAAEEIDIPHELTRRVHGVRLYAPSLRHIDLFAPGYYFLTTRTPESRRAGSPRKRCAPACGSTSVAASRVPSGMAPSFACPASMSKPAILGADGGRSAVARHFGLGRNTRFLIGLEAEHAGLDGVDPRFLHCFLDSRIAPGYLAWVAPGPTCTQVGLAVTDGETASLDAFRGKTARLFRYESSQIAGSPSRTDPRSAASSRPGRRRASCWSAMPRAKFLP